MASIVKYGHYWISAGILITGAVWLIRPGDPRVMGEDYADIFEDVQEKLVVPYLTGDNTPDWNAANTSWSDAPSNSIASAIRYQDIWKMANRIRHFTTRSDASIFWTDRMFSDTNILAVSHGGFRADEEFTGVKVDALNGGGWNVTNRFYRYTTNTFSDALVTTATRAWTNGSAFEAVMPTDNGSDVAYLSISRTNLPLSNLVFGRGAAAGLTNSAGFRTLGSWWPFQWSYSFPWEQWSYASKSRVTVAQQAYANVSWTNVLWISTNSLALSAAPYTNSLPGFSASSFMDVSYNLSEPFVYIKPPANNNNLYLSTYTYTPSVPYPFNYVDIRVSKGESAYNAVVSGSVVYGDDELNITPAGQGYYFTDFSIIPTTNTVQYSVIKFISANTNHPSIYAFISWTNNPAALSNEYFSLSSRSSVGADVSATATTNAIAYTFTATDDKRITTNKLNAFAHVLTNMNRTIYIGSASSISCTGYIQTVTSHASTNYFDEFLDGEGDTPTYYSAYDREALADDFSTVTAVTTNTAVASYVGHLSEFTYSMLVRGFSETYTNNSPVTWYSSVYAEGATHERKRTIYRGCTLAYPSAWACTNGMVSNVTVYAVLEAVPTYANTYYNWPAIATYGSMYSHSVGGEYWHEGNLGVSVSNFVINTPSHSVTATRTKGLNRQFYGSGNLEFADTAVFCKVYSTNSPSGGITFDMPEMDVTHADPTARYAYFQWTGSNGSAKVEGWQYEYLLGYRIQVSRIMVVVDWNFKHIGRGFTPVNNTPEWR